VRGSCFSRNLKRGAGAVFDLDPDEDLTRAPSGVLPLLQNRNPVAKDVMDAGGILKGLFIGCPVADRFRIENDDIGFMSRPDQTPVRKAQLLGRQAGHFVDRFLQAQDLFLPNILRNDSRKGPKRSRMRSSLSQGPLGGNNKGIGTDHHGRMP